MPTDNDRADAPPSNLEKALQWVQSEEGQRIINEGQERAARAARKLRDALAVHPSTLERKNADLRSQLDVANARLAAYERAASGNAVGEVMQKVERYANECVQVAAVNSEDMKELYRAEADKARDALRATVAGIVARAELAERERDAMKPVVEAAKKWKAAHVDMLICGSDSVQASIDAEFDLMDAVDALDGAKEERS